MEVKIQIPDNCELIKDGDTYIVKEKKNDKPRIWEEFCEKYPIKKGEAYIDSLSNIIVAKSDFECRKELTNSNWCTSKEEAEAFLALMQLRQLRKAWICDWEQPNSHSIVYVIKYDLDTNKVRLASGNFWGSCTLSFPTLEMAKEFLNCFKDLCETAKMLL